MEPKRELLYFSAIWCGPCVAMKPIIAELAKDVPITPIDVDDMDQQSVSIAHNIRKIPQFVYLVDGVERGRLTGAQTLGDLKALVLAS